MTHPLPCVAVAFNIVSAHLVEYIDYRNAGSLGGDPRWKP